MNENKENKTRAEKALGYLASLPIVLALLSLLAEVLLQSTFTYSLETDYTLPHVTGLLFSASGLAFYQLLGSYDVGMIQSALAAVNIVLALLFLFLSSAAMKGKKWALPVVSGLYAADAVLSLALFALSGLSRYVVPLSAVDIALNVLFHVLGLGGLAYALYLAFRVGKERKKDGNE